MFAQVTETDVGFPLKTSNREVFAQVTETDVTSSVGGTVRVDCSAPAQYAQAFITWSRVNGEMPQVSADKQCF